MALAVVLLAVVGVVVATSAASDESYPERDWVGKFDGHQLHPIAHYNANDAAQVFAVPW